MTCSAVTAMTVTAAMQTLLTMTLVTWVLQIGLTQPVLCVSVTEVMEECPLAYSIQRKYVDGC